MPSCKEVSRLVSESMDHQLPLRKRLGLWFHLSMCRLCSGFSKELKLIGQAARQQGQPGEDASSSEAATLSSDARERLQRALERQNRENQ